MLGRMPAAVAIAEEDVVASVAHAPQYISYFDPPDYTAQPARGHA
jgi:hypothetical protein